MPENLYPQLPTVPSMSQESFNIEMVRKYYQDIANLKEKYTEKQRKYKNAYNRLLHASTGASTVGVVSGVSTIGTAFTVVGLPISASLGFVSTVSTCKSVTETVPTYFKEKEPPIISYTYTKTIASKIFNFSSTLSDLDYHQFHNNPTQCECNTSSHLYQPYGHVITGDLSIIPNSKLRDLIAKGPKYREPCKVDWDKNLSLLCEAVDQYALQWTKREMVELSMVGIPMETNCAPLLADLFLYSYENEFLDKLIKEGKRKLARRFNLSYRYIDDLISFNNKRFKEFISDIYPKELTISETTESTSVASYLDLLFTRDRSNNITNKLYDKRDAFGFHIVNFPFMSSNIPSAPAYGVYASQLVRYACCCSNYSDFLIRHRALVKRLLSQGYKVNRLSNTFKKFYGRHTDLVGQYKKNVCQMFADSIS